MVIPHIIVYYICRRSDFMHVRIKELRKENKMSQQEFADKIHISRSQLSYYESGTVAIPERSQKEICEKFNVNLEWLQSGTGDKYQPQPEVNEIDVLMGMFNPEEDEFKTKIITAMLKLDDNGWNAIKSLAEEILK